MHVLIVGRGGREHALAWKLARSPRVDRITVAPGNGGTAMMAPRVQNVEIDDTDIVSLLEFAEHEGVDMTVVGPEEPLATGLVDQFLAAGQRIFGPHRQAALLETSKSYAKEIMARHGVPTPAYEVFSDLESAMDFVIAHHVERILIKADGVTRGKGVFVPAGHTDAEGILRALLERDALDGAGRRVVIEERLIGQELGLMAFTDGQTLAMMPPMRDHRRLYDGETGPSTPGMGAYAPSPLLTPELAERALHEIMLPLIEGIQSERCCFSGVLYVGIALTPEGLVALDISPRLSDPGTQVALPLLDTDLMDVIEACTEGTLDQVDVRWKDQAAVSVVLATEGYPERDDPGIPILQSSVMPDGVVVFHAGTRIAEDGTLVTTGGRVLDVTGIGPDLATAITMAYDGVRRVHFEGAHYRTDIGARALHR